MTFARTSDSRRIRTSSVPTLISVPPYLLKMISSSSATSIGMCFPSSSRLPGPTARTRPRCGFSLAVSGSTMPLTVCSSSSRTSTIRRSPSGFRFIQLPPDLLQTAVSVTPSGTLTRRVPEHCTSDDPAPQAGSGGGGPTCYNSTMEREFSAGGVLVRTVRGRTMVAAIRPQGKPEGTWALPKGNLDPGESPAETAVREVWEETGVHGRLVEKLGDVRYTYTRRGGLRVFKIVSFYLLRAGRG